MQFVEQLIFRAQSAQVVESFGGPPETRTPDPLIKSFSRLTPQTTTCQKSKASQEKKSQLLSGRCRSLPHMHAQNTHNRLLKQANEESVATHVRCQLTKFSQWISVGCSASGRAKVHPTVEFGFADPRLNHGVDETGEGIISPWWVVWFFE